MRGAGRRLSSQIFAFQVGILLACGLVGALLAVHGVQQRLDGEYEQRALAVAAQRVRPTPGSPPPSPGRTAAARSSAAPRPSGARRTPPSSSTDRPRDPLFAPGARRASASGSAPTPSEALAGRTVTAVETGTLGRSARAKVPLRDAHGDIAGVVSVGILESTIRPTSSPRSPTVALYVGAALAIGLLASLRSRGGSSARRSGSSCNEIAALVQEREAMLHGIREGVVALDRAGRVRLSTTRRSACSSSATRPSAGPRRRSAPTPTADCSPGRVTGRDLRHRPRRACRWSPTGCRPPTAATRRRRHAARPHRAGAAGASSTSTRGLTDALRAQDHEYVNRMHTLLGPRQLGHHDEAVDFVREIVGGRRHLRRELADRVDDPLLSALLVAKSTVATERGVAAAAERDTLQRGELLDGRPVLTVVGNLIDNALDAAPGGLGDPWVDVTLATEGSTLVVEVADSGPGVPAPVRDRVFDDGFTTKATAGPGARGVGLALARRIADRRGGSLQVSDAPGGGALFTARLPGAVRALEEAAP